MKYHTNQLVSQIIEGLGENDMPIRESLRWKIELPDPAEVLCEDEHDERKTLAWIVFALFVAGVVTSTIAVIAYLT